MTETRRSIKKIIFLIVLVLLGALFIAGYVISNRTTGSKIITVGDRAPDFRLQKADGSQVSLSDLRGRVVVVHFWATWCPPCIEEMPTLDRLHSSPLGANIEMLAVSEDEGNAGAALSFLQQNRLSVPVLFDPGSAIARLYGTFKLPETYIVDQQGVVRYKAIGPKDWTDPALVQIVKNIVGSD